MNVLLLSPHKPYRFFRLFRAFISSRDTGLPDMEAFLHETDLQLERSGFVFALGEGDADGGFGAGVACEG